jgi:hypothetical protein
VPPVSLHWVIAVGRRDQDNKFLPSRGIRRQYSFLKKLKRIYDSYTVGMRAVRRDHILPPDKRGALDSRLSASLFYP